MAKKQKSQASIKAISKKTFYVVEGLLAIAKRKYQEAHDIIDMVALQLGQSPEGTGSEPSYYGHVLDALYSDYSPRELLNKLGIKVK